MLLIRISRKLLLKLMLPKLVVVAERLKLPQQSRLWQAYSILQMVQLAYLKHSMFQNRAFCQI